MENTIIEKEFNKISKSLSKMTSLVITNIDETIQALRYYDRNLAEKVIDNDEQVNAMEVKIEKDCVIFIATNQPVASDLRIIQSIYKISTDIERIGDQAKDISKLILEINDNIFDFIHEKAILMANEVKLMVSDSIRSFINRDIKLAYDVVKRDSKIDDYYKELKEDIFEKVSNDVKINKRDFINFLFIVKYLEKMGDHAENIANWIIYNVVGDFVKRGV